jgi:hypothetical protein
MRRLQGAAADLESIAHDGKRPPTMPRQGMASDFGEWRSMETAPRDGTRILVALKPTEQGPGTSDVARWARPHPREDECWVASDSDLECVIVYADSDLDGWMPMPTPGAGVRH